MRARTQTTGDRANPVRANGFHFFTLLFFIFTLIVAQLYSLHSGPVAISWSSIFNFVTTHLLETPTPADGPNFVLATLRLPRTLAATLVGASLGACGLVLQTLLKNPLAEPYTLGLSGGSSLGAVVALYLALEPATLWVPALSTAGCLIASAMVIALAGRRVAFESRSLILFGVMTSLFFGALVVTGLSILSPQKLQSALFWLLGEFGTSRDVWIYKIGPWLVIAMLGIFSKGHGLDALSLGEARALSLGYDPKRERLFLILLCTVLTALSVSIAGLVGFIGLVSPHLARRLTGTSNHRALIVTSALAGATLLTLADSLARTVAGNGEIPAGSVSALIGAPVLIYFLMSQRHAALE